MKTILRSFVLFLLLGQALVADQFVYVASRSSLLVYKVDLNTGSLSLLQTVLDDEVAGINRPFAMSALSPDKKFLYVNTNGGKKGSTKLPPAIITYAINSNGTLKKVATTACKFHVFFGLSPQGNYIFAIQGGGRDKQEVAAYKLNRGICNQGPIATAEVAETGKHSVRMGPEGKFVYIPHIRTNQIYQYRFNEKSMAFTALKPLAVPGPNKEKFPTAHDPRHLYFNTNCDVLYTSNEYGGGISSWKKDPKTGSLTLWQTKSTLPAGYKFLRNSKEPDDSKNIYNKASDIHVSPDNKFVYVANRENHNRESSLDSGNDTIAVFGLSKTGELSELLYNIPTGRHVRSLGISETGEYLYATGVFSGTLHVYKRDLKTGNLTLLDAKDGQPNISGLVSPMWLTPLTLP